MRNAYTRFCYCCQADTMHDSVGPMSVRKALDTLGYDLSQWPARPLAVDRCQGCNALTVSCLALRADSDQWGIIDKEDSI